MAWKDLCVPRREGGLGLKQLKAWNSTAMGKLLWRIHSREKDIWTTWISCKLKGRNIWQIPIPFDCAWSWRKLLQLRGKFKSFMTVKLGDGRECSLFYDQWMGNSRLCDLIDCTQWQGYRVVGEWIRDGNWAIPSSFSRRYSTLSQSIQSVEVSSA